MPIIKILPHPEYCPEGREIEAAPGESICEALLENGIAIEHACEMSCACTTCHVVVREGFASLGELDESEEDLLDRAWGLEPTSRLSCQAILSRAGRDGRDPEVLDQPRQGKALTAARGRARADQRPSCVGLPGGGTSRACRSSRRTSRGRCCRARRAGRGPSSMLEEGLDLALLQAAALDELRRGS